MWQEPTATTAMWFLQPGWNITVEDVEINASLENVSVDLGYTGVETSDYKKEADAGKTFCSDQIKD